MACLGCNSRSIVREVSSNEGNCCNFSSTAAGDASGQCMPLGAEAVGATPVPATGGIGGISGACIINCPAAPIGRPVVPIGGGGGTPGDPIGGDGETPGAPICLGTPGAGGSETPIGPPSCISN